MANTSSELDGRSTFQKEGRSDFPQRLPTLPSEEMHEPEQWRNFHIRKTAWAIFTEFLLGWSRATCHFLNCLTSSFHTEKRDRAHSVYNYTKIQMANFYKSPINPYTHRGPRTINEFSSSNIFWLDNGVIIKLALSFNFGIRKGFNILVLLEYFGANFILRTNSFQNKNRPDQKVQLVRMSDNCEIHSNNAATKNTSITL